MPFRPNIARPPLCSNALLIPADATKLKEGETVPSDHTIHERSTCDSFVQDPPLEPQLLLSNIRAATRKLTLQVEADRHRGTSGDDGRPPRLVAPLGTDARGRGHGLRRSELRNKGALRTLSVPCLMFASRRLITRTLFSALTGVKENSLMLTVTGSPVLAQSEASSPVSSISPRRLQLATIPDLCLHQHSD